MVEAKIALELILVIRQGDDGRHERAVDQRRDDVVDIDDARAEPPHRGDHIARVDADLAVKRWSNDGQTMVKR